MRETVIRAAKGKGVRGMNSIKGAAKSLAGSLLACTAMLTLAAVPAFAGPTMVTACGTLSADNVVYQLSANITTATTGDCLVLKGSHSALDLFGFTVTGPGVSSNGSGIKVKGDDDLVEGLNGFVEGFKYGATDEGRSTVGDEINLDYDHIGLRLRGHTDSWNNMEAAWSTTDGVLIDYCNDDCSISDVFSHDNGANGVTVIGSDGTRVLLFTATSNGGDGIHVGCMHHYCRDTEVKVADGYAGIGDASDPFGPNGVDGVVLDSSESKSRDQVSVVQATGNTIDLYDLTDDCGDNPFNLWFDNLYDTSKAGTMTSPACILTTLVL